MAAAACGSAGTHPVAAGSSPTPSTSVSASPPVSGSPSPAGTVPPVPSAVLQALSVGSERLTVVTSPASVLTHPAQSQAAALRTALGQEPRGSKVLGLTLARLKGFGSDLSRYPLAWLVSMDPYGGDYSANGPGCGQANYVVEFIDPGSGRWLSTQSGHQPGLPSLPALGPSPSPVKPSASCGVPVPSRPHLGTPAAN
jgi:hypothetical protein